MDLKKAQKEIFQNKINKGFNTKIGYILSIGSNKI